MPHMFSRIFLLSHMRAYTSLIGHILGSHPQINGYYEMHLSYRSSDDLAAQVKAYATHDTLKPGSRYLFDKLLHNDYVLKPEQLGLLDVQLLLALRQPEPTIKSIVHLFAQKRGNAPYTDPTEATEYYCGRLAWLAAFARQYPQRYCYFDAELIRTDTASLLKRLGQWLSLEGALSPSYQQFSKTGVAGAGDSSPAIKSGKVITEANPYAAVVLDAALLQQAEHAYQQCRAVLIGNAREMATMG